MEKKSTGVDEKRAQCLRLFIAEIIEREKHELKTKTPTRGSGAHAAQSTNKLDLTYLETLNGANDISADPLTKSPMIPFH